MSLAHPSIEGTATESHELLNQTPLSNQRRQKPWICGTYAYAAICVAERMVGQRNPKRIGNRLDSHANVVCG